MGTTAEKLAYLKETKNQIKQALETPSNVMREYSKWIEKYIQNQPTNTVTDGICKNALDVPLVSLGVDGNSEQKQYEGYNLLPNIVHKDDETYITNGITFTKNKDGSITANGTATATANYNLVSENPSARRKISAGSYMISGCPSGGSNSKYKLTIGVTEVNEYYDFGDGRQITISADNTYYFKIAIFSGQTVSNLTFYPMLITGTESKPYEPYVGGQPSPNPEYPQDIEVIKGFEEGNKYGLPHGHIGLRQSGKNLFDWNGVSNTSIATFDNGIATLNWSSGFDCFLLHKENQIFSGLDTSKTYKISFKHKGNGIILKDYQTTGNNVITNTDSDYVTYSFSVTGVKSIRLDVVRASSTSGTAQIKELMVSELTDDTYELYHEPKIISINLNGNSIAKVGDVKDLLKIYRNGDVEIEKKIGKYILNPNDWILRNTSDNGTYTYSMKVPLEYKIISNPSIISNKFINLGVASSVAIMYKTFLDKVGISLYYDVTTPTTRAVYINSNMTIDNLEGTEIYYQLSTPQTIKLPSIDSIELWEGTNKFELITNLDTTFEMEYVINKNNILDEIQTAMLDAEIEI